MLEALVADSEVRTKHGGTELVAIATVTDECVDQVFAFNRLLIVNVSDIDRKKNSCWNNLQMPTGQNHRDRSLSLSRLV